MNAKHTVLYADDDIDDIQLLTEVFEDHTENIEFITFSNGLELLAYLKNLQPNQSLPCLVILDINMPLLNGTDTLVRIRDIEKFKDIPVIMFTTSSSQRDKDFAFKYNAGFFTKPINYVQLETVANILISQCNEPIRDQVRKQKVK